MPHNWESGLWFDETTATVFAGDLFTHAGQGPALTEDDVVDPALATEELFHATSLGPAVGSTIAGLAPTTLALMHGSSFHGDGATQLRALAAGNDAAAADAATAAADGTQVSHLTRGSGTLPA